MAETGWAQGDVEGFLAGWPRSMRRASVRGHGTCSPVGCARRCANPRTWPVIPRWERQFPAPPLLPPWPTIVCAARPTPSWRTG